MNSQRERKECRTAEDAADALDGELQSGDLRLLAVFELGQDLEILLRGRGQIWRTRTDIFVAVLMRLKIPASAA